MMINLFVAVVVGGLILIGRNVAKKRGHSQILGAIVGLAIGGGITICGVTLLLISGPIIGNILKSSTNSLYSPISISETQPTLFLGTFPTNTPDPCFTWAQITIAMEGKTVCVKGNAAQVYPVYGNAATRINFTSMPNTFFLISVEYEFFYSENGTNHKLTVGDCVQATETVKVFDDGRHQIPYMQISDLYRCAP
jgi:hypothetical protein